MNINIFENIKPITVTTYLWFSLILFFAHYFYLISLSIFKTLHSKSYSEVNYKKLFTETKISAYNLISPDLTTAKALKSAIEFRHSSFVKKYIKTIFTKKWNKTNLYITIISYICVTTAITFEMHYQFLFYVALIRCYSRSLEILIAFYFDVISSPKKQNTFLTKYCRMKLAIFSYIEIYFLYAAFYGLFIKESFLSSLKASLSIGTLTNVGEYLSDNALSPFIFMQIFTTLMLVIVSIAVYIGRVK